MAQMATDSLLLLILQRLLVVCVNVCAPLRHRKAYKRAYITEKLLLHIFFINHQKEDL